MTSHPPGVAKELSLLRCESVPDVREKWSRWPTSTATWCIALLTVVAAILRISFLGSKSLWIDEGMTACRDMWPIKRLLVFLVHKEMNMFLYYLLLHGWTSIAGSSEFVLRFPSALFDTATVPLIYVLGRELGNRRAGLIAALMVTLNASSIQYAQTARSYAMFITLAILASVFFIRSVKRDSMGDFAGYIISGTCDVYTHLFGIFSLPAQWLSLFVWRPRRNIAGRLTACVIAIGVLSVPAFFFGLMGYHGNIAWVPETSLHSIANLFFVFVGAFDGRPTILTLSLTAVYALGIALAILFTPRADRSALGYVLLSICIPIGITITISIFKTLLVARYLLAELPLYALLAAIGFARLKPGFALVMVVVIAMLGLGEDYCYYRAPSIQDWRGATDFIATNSQPGDALIIYPSPYRCLTDYYLSRGGPEALSGTVITQAPGDRNVNENVRRLFSTSRNGAGRRIWLTFPLSDPLDVSSVRQALTLNESLTNRNLQESVSFYWNHPVNAECLVLIGIRRQQLTGP